jgi:arginine/ornithine N-succinyltransferase beta subunit
VAPEPVSTQRVTIRPYQPADLDALYRVCLQTGRNGFTQLPATGAAVFAMDLTG